MGNTQPYRAPTNLLQCINEETGDLDPFLYFQFARNPSREASKEEDDEFYQQLGAILGDGVTRH